MQEYPAPGQAVYAGRILFVRDATKKSAQHCNGQRAILLNLTEDVVVRLGLLSDTHITGPHQALPDQLWRAFDGVDAILHAGDLTNDSVLEVLAAIAPVYAVRGNCDQVPLPAVRRLQYEGVCIGLTHGHLGRGATTALRAADAAGEVDVLVYGHSHRPVVQWVGQCLHVNPGSPTQRRHAPRYSCARLTLVDGQAAAELVDWD